MSVGLEEDADILVGLFIKIFLTGRGGWEKLDGKLCQPEAICIVRN
jgi:hypothetical protein